MNKEYNEIIHTACHHSQVVTIYGQGHNSSAIPEDDKLTLRLSYLQQTESEDSSPYHSPSELDHEEGHQKQKIGREGAAG